MSVLTFGLVYFSRTIIVFSLVHEGTLLLEDSNVRKNEGPIDIEWESSSKSKQYISEIDHIMNLLIIHLLNDIFSLNKKTLKLTAPGEK